LPLLLLLLMHGFCMAGELKISFHEQAEITGTRIVLGDIAEISPPDGRAEELLQRSVGPAPRPGRTKTLKTSAIRSYLELTDESLAAARWLGPESIKVQRRGLKLGPEQVQQIMAEYLRRNLDRLPPADIRFVPGGLPKPVTLPYGKLSWEVIPSNPDIISSSTFGLLLRIDGRTVENLTIRGRLEAWTDVVIAAATIRKGALIGAEALSLSRRDIARLKDPILSKREVVGRLADRTIHAGRALEKRHIKLPPHIRKGQQVKIVASKGALNISAMGIAAADGRRGDMIRVRNIQSNKLIYCKVAAPGLVTVSF